MKVLIADKTSEAGLQILRDAGFQVDINLGLSEDEIVGIIPQYDAMVVRSATKVTPKILEHADNLKVVGRAGVGVDNIDIPAATKKGVIVMNTPTGNTISAAEHTVAMLMAISRNIPQAHTKLKNKEWFKKQYVGTEVYGKTLGVIGFGKIGSHVAKVLRGFGMNIIVYDPFVTAESIAETDYTLIEEMDDIFKQADYITCHIPKQEKPIIGEAELALMKPTAYLINVARGGVVDEKALYNALKNNKIKGAALDVFENEPKKEGSEFPTELTELDNVILTPHLGASTQDAQEKVAVDIAYQFIDYLKNNIIKNALNVPSADPLVSPFLPLAEKLGSLAAQICGCHVEEIKIGFHGKLAELDTKMLKLAAMKGILSTFCESTNYVNAPVLASERKITVTESKSAKVTSYVNLINIQVNNTVVAGTLFENNMERIVQINDFEMDLSPSKYYVLTEHDDVPGVVGKVGTILGDNSINIEGMGVGKTQKHKEAIMVLAIDKPLPEEINQKIALLEEVVSVKSIKL